MSKDFENNDLNREPNNFGLPEGYFQNSASSIFNKIEWMDEHKQYPRLSELNKESGFIVPRNYFDASESELELIDYPNLLQHKKDAGFIVPQNYFEELEVSELAKVISQDPTRSILPMNSIEEDELNSISKDFLEEEFKHELTGFDLLNSIEKKNSFVVSENYFESSLNKISSAVRNKEQATRNKEQGTKVIRLFSAKIIYSAAAAMLVITLGIWIYNQYFKPVATNGDCGTLACVDKKDIIKAKI
ncbi:MAG: hypothetical protein K0S32_3657, partial [Bacteroidetes bacterium]|nr:hypothetical protein [Bacteroidota bacterium]